MEFITILLLGYFSTAVLAVQLQVSELAYYIKALFYLNTPNPKIRRLSTLRFWVSLLGSSFTILSSPLIFTIIILCKLQLFIQKLLNCSYCTSYHLGWMLGYFIFGMTFPYALIYGFVATGFVIILNSINKF